jgi:hypothetical protein
MKINTLNGVSEEDEGGQEEEGAREGGGAQGPEEEAGGGLSRSESDESDEGAGIDLLWGEDVTEYLQEERKREKSERELARAEREAGGTGVFVSVVN